MSQGAALYNALEVDVRRSFANGFQLRGNYTWSKNLDDGSAWNTSVSGNTPAYVVFPLHPRLDWGPAATDVRQSASINGSYDLPFGPQPAFLNHAPAPVDFLAGGWTTSAIVTLQTGFPFSPQLGYNPPGNGDSRNPVRPSWNPSFTGNLYPQTPGEWFNPNAFIPPTVTLHTPTCGGSNTCGTYGNVSRDSLAGPGLSELDFSRSQKHTHHGAARIAVPRRVLQHPQPHQLPHPERGGVLFGDHRGFAHGWRDNGHFHILAADSIRSKFQF